jgi:hypothetical protein
MQGWYFGPRLARSSDALDSNESKRVKIDIIGPIPFGHAARLTYTEDEYNSLCSGGTDKSRIESNYIKYLLTEEDSDEYQMCATTTLGDGSKETVVAGVAYGFGVDLGRTLDDVPYAFDILDDKFSKHCYDIAPAFSTDEELDEYVDDVLQKAYNKFLEYLRQFERALFISLLCSPLRKSGAGGAFIEWIKNTQADTYGIIVLKVIDAPETIAFYEKLGFQHVVFQGGTYELSNKHVETEPNYMILEIPYRAKRFKCGSGCDV